MNRKRKGPVTAKKTECDGIKFESGLEKYMYKALKDAGIEAEYEPHSYIIHPSFEFPLDCYERQSNGKGEFINRGGKKVQNIKYTPDFVGKDFIIECKGRANESFPIRWKMFKMFAAEYLPGYVIYKPQNQAECEEVIKLITERINGRVDRQRRGN
jgi:hypothetical protein